MKTDIPQGAPAPRFWEAIISFFFNHRRYRPVDCRLWTGRSRTMLLGVMAATIVALRFFLVERLGRHGSGHHQCSNARHDHSDSYRHFDRRLGFGGCSRDIGLLWTFDSFAVDLLACDRDHSRGNFLGNGKQLGAMGTVAVALMGVEAGLEFPYRLSLARVSEGSISGARCHCCLMRPISDCWINWAVWPRSCS
ncbi:hypothetical protein [Litoreibacter arenae]|uniref:hypothetical protein n=1 Tax=Litoreibacter arenae TaxID=491388 RepID=UPI0012B6759F|nr:hypothetical protein [Litoreibacter arenae]